MTSASVMIPTLPVEIWQLILEHALIFHPFFSTDPVADSTENRYNAAIDDWFKTPVVEKLFRIVLRQVCHHWKTFVDRPEIKLRFVHMADIASRRLSVADLMQARRIEAPHQRYLQGNPSIFMGRIGLAQPSSEDREDGDSVFKAEIMTDLTAPVSRITIERHPSAFLHLKALHLDLSDCPTKEKWAPINFANISKNFPSIVFLYLKMETAPLYFQDIFHLQSLRTLVIASLYPLTRLSFDQWSFPSLLHLKISKLGTDVTLRGFLAALSHLGRGLKLLDVEFNIVDEDPDDVMPRIWSDCPKLESLRFPLSLLITHPPAPDRHPLRYLVDSEGDPRGSCRTAIGVLFPTDFTSTLIFFCNALPSLLVVRDSHDWTSIFFRDLDNIAAATDFRMKFDQDCCQQMVKTAVRIKALKMAVRFEDLCERTWEQASVRSSLIS